VVALTVWQGSPAPAQNLLNGGKMFPQQDLPKPLPTNNYITQGPVDTGTPTRPSSWPGAAPEAGANLIRQGPTGAPAPQPGGPNWVNGDRAMQFDLVDLDSARPIARVGPEVIQDYEVSAYVNEVLEQYAAKIPPGQLEKVRDKLTHDRLNHLIEVKLALVDAQRKVPPEAYPKIMDSLAGEYEKSEVKRKIKQLKLNTRGDLEARLRERGTSLERDKQAFVEQQLAFGWIQQQTKTKHEVTHEDMLAYYLEHLDVYSFGAQARWEELRVRVPNYPSRAAARLALGDMGNAVLQGGNFADVARARSQGPTASLGGQYDWTTQGSLASDMVDHAIFSLEPGRMSQILDDGRGPAISIVRVIERKEAGRRPFTDVQNEIKEKLSSSHQEKDKQKLRDYMAKLRAETPIWTIYDEQSRPEQGAIGQQPSPTATPATTLRPTMPQNGKSSPGNPNPYLR
jgi:PPIC-type PPIASE domain